MAKQTGPNSLIPTLSAHASYPGHSLAYVPPPHDLRGYTLEQEQDAKNLEPLLGFIFLCNGRTKPECYRYRVFGLPAGRMEVIQRIEPGALLFLFDFDVKLLYGVYMATSYANFNLEPDAFEGKFPAQVRFKISKQCLPLLESSFRGAILDNYKKGKFKQELNNQQVMSLLALFRPLPMASSIPKHLTMANATTPLARLLPAEDEHLQPQARIHPDVQLVGSLRQNHSSIVLRPRHNSQQMVYSQYAHGESLADLSPNYQPVPAQALPDPGLSRLGDPFVVSVQNSHPTILLQTERAPQTILSSQIASYGALATIGQYHTSTGLQTSAGSTSMYHPTLAQKPYLPVDSASPPMEPNYGCIAVGQASAVDLHLVTGNDFYHQLSYQGKLENIQQQDSNQHYYPEYVMPAISQDPTCQQFYAVASGNTGQAGTTIPVCTSHLYGGAAVTKLPDNAQDSPSISKHVGFTQY